MSDCATREFDLAQIDRLNRLLDDAWNRNPFYRRKWQRAGLSPDPVRSWRQFIHYPLTTRQELIEDQNLHPPCGANLSLPLDCYKRFHRSSGTTQAPLLWADTAETWAWVLSCSQELFRISGVDDADRVLFLADFGASSGPWIMYEGACRLGCACFAPGASLPSALEKGLSAWSPTIVVGKPSRLQVGFEMPRILPSASVRAIILTGDFMTVQARRQLEDGWGVPSRDRYGLTEAGSVAAECPAGSQRLHLLDEAFIAECLDPETGKPVPRGMNGELVLTNLGRNHRPIIRYRTGDFTKIAPDESCACGRRGTQLLGGIHRRASPKSEPTAKSANDHQSS